MTVELMREATKQELSALSPEAKREVMALVRNRLCVVIGCADLIRSQVTKYPEDSARMIVKDAQRLLEEFQGLLSVDPNAALGAVEQTKG